MTHFRHRPESRRAKNSTQFWSNAALARRNNEAVCTLSSPASKKRQGTKSRGVWHRQGSECHGDLMLAAVSIAGGARSNWIIRVANKSSKLVVNQSCECQPCEDVKFNDDHFD